MSKIMDSNFDINNLGFNGTSVPDGFWQTILAVLGVVAILVLIYSIIIVVALAHALAINHQF